MARTVSRKDAETFIAMRNTEISREQAAVAKTGTEKAEEFTERYNTAQKELMNARQRQYAVQGIVKAYEAAVEAGEFSHAPTYLAERAVALEALADGWMRKYYELEAEALHAKHTPLPWDHESRPRQQTVGCRFPLCVREVIVFAYDAGVRHGQS